MLKRLILAAALMIVTPAVLQAQTPKVEQTKTFSVAASHDGLNTDNYTIAVTPNSGGAAVITGTLPVTQLLNGDITFSGLVAPARGVYNVVICATNLDSLSACSDPLQFQTTKGQPNKPGKPRIVSGLIAFFRAPDRFLTGMIAKAKGKPEKGVSSLRIIIDG